VEGLSAISSISIALAADATFVWWQKFMWGAVVCSLVLFDFPLSVYYSMVFSSYWVLFCFFSATFLYVFTLSVVSC
jgi:hypothetical protein